MASENLTIPHFSLSRPLTVSEGYDLPRSPDLESKIVPDPRGGAINSIHVTGPHVRAGLLLPIFDRNDEWKIWLYRIIKYFESQSKIQVPGLWFCFDILDIQITQAGESVLKKVKI